MANEQQVRARITEAEQRLRAAEHAHLTAKIEAELRAEHEEQRMEELAALRSDLDVAAERRAEKVQTLESRLRQQQEVNEKAEAELQERIQAEARLIDQLIKIVPGLTANSSQSPTAA